MFAATTHVAKAGSSFIGTALHPIFIAVGDTLAFFYGLIPNYAVAIALLTVAVMILVFPLTRASSRSMMRMQLLAPEMKKIQNRYKAKAGMTAQERTELRQKMNEEVMALYRENGVNPTGGCLPMFLQFPVMIVLYDVVRGLAKQADLLNAKGQKTYVKGVLQTKPTPQNIPTSSRMYHDLILAHGQMHVLGINLADSVRSHQPSLVDVIPYALLVLVAVGLQYVSIWQVTTRNPAASQANPQMQSMQKYMPLIFLFIYIALPAGVGLYFIVSSLFRVGQQEWMYKHDKTIVAAIDELTKRKRSDEAAGVASDDQAKSGARSRAGGGGKSFMQRMREATGVGSPKEPDAEGAGQPAVSNGSARSGTNRPSTSGNQNRSGSGSGAKRPNPQRAAGSARPSSGSKSQPRSRAKRPRRGR
ncbi:MAG: membrane protein insertase YidC [Acidimicrobiales bacterium]